MKPSTVGRIAALAVVGAGALASVAPAAAATTNPFGCRASVGRGALTSPFQVTVEPIVANAASTPCATDSQGTQTLTLGSSAVGATLTAGPTGAFTYSTQSADPIEGLAPGAASLASTSNIKLSTSQGTVEVESIQAQASYACVGGLLQSASSSSIGGLLVNGQPVSLPTSGAPYKLALGSNGSYVAINDTESSATSLTRRAVYVHIVGVGDFVISEARVTHGAGNPCSGTAGVQPVLAPCATESVYNPLTKSCVIPPGIKVSNPFHGPTGGTVMSVKVARTILSSPCLNGPGPKYVIVGTDGADRINGTKKADRILGLRGNDRIAGLGGNDCIDGGAGADKLFEGNGSDHVYGGAGNDRIAVGNGADAIRAGAGNDRVTAGNGRDSVHGDAGADRIDLGLGHNTVWGDAGNDRVFDSGSRARVDCGAGINVAFVNRASASWDRSHGCRVHVVR